MEPTKRTRSDTMSWLGCGCGLLVFLALAGIVGLTWFGYRQGKEMEAGFKDPATRTANARAVLPWRELPPGYHPVGSFSVPLLMEMAIFSDREPEAETEGGEDDRDPEFGESGLFYMKFHPWVSDEAELLAWLRGETKEAPGWIRRSQAEMDPDEVAHRGTIEIEGQTVTYAVARGSDVGDDDNRGDNGARQEEQPASGQPQDQDPGQDGPQRRSPEQEGLMTFFSFDCPGDERARLGVWFGPDPSPATPVKQLNLTGTVGDPEKLRGMLGHFSLCG